jgi:FkbM family methyltransferase
MNTFHRPLLDFLNRRHVARGARLIEPLLRGRKRVLGFANPMYFSHRVVDRAGARYVVPADNYIALGASPRQLVRFDGDEFEPEMSYLIDGLIEEHDVVLDVGANVGLHTVAFARRARKGHVFAFEPVAEMAEHAAANCALNRLGNVTVLNYALGAAPAELEMAVNVAGAGMQGTSSLVRTHNYEANPGDYAARKVPVRRLDDVIGALAPGRRIGFIKIDTEGYDTQVLEGGLDTIRRDRPAMLVEAHSRRIEAAGKSWQWFLDTFPDHHVFMVMPVTNLKPHAELVPLTPDQPEIAVNLLMVPRVPVLAA